MKNQEYTWFLHFCAICLIITTSLTIKAQNTQEFKFRHTTVENGLSCNNIRALLQDHNGFIWIGTDDGLNKYDGQNITIPRGPKTNASIQSLCESGDTIWVGCNSGLLMYSQRCDSVAPVNKKTKQGVKITSVVSGLQTDAKGGLWITTMEQGIFYLSPKGILKQYFMPGKDTQVANVLVTKKGEVWVISNWCRHNLARYNKKKDIFETVTPKLQGDDSTIRFGGISMIQDASGTFWVGTWDNGLIRLDSYTMEATIVARSSNICLRHIHWITEADKDHLYIGSDEGLSIYDKKTGNISHYREDELSASSLSDKFVYPILKDREGGIWVGTFYGGLNYAHPETANFNNYSRSLYHNSVNGNVISNFSEDGGGNIWVASDDGGLSVFNRQAQTFFSYDTHQGGRTRNIHGLYVDGYNIYIGTYTGGMDILDVRTGEEKHYPKFIDANGRSWGSSSYAIHKDRKGRIWVGTFSDILMFNPSTGLFKHTKETRANTIDIDEDKNGNVWFTTDEEGIFRLGTNGKWTRYNSFCIQKNDNNSCKTTTNSLYEDANGTIWAGTTNGLFRYDRQKDKFTPIALRGQHPNVKGVTGENGKLWLTTSLGLMVYDVKENRTPRAYTSGDGLDNINFLQNAIFKASDGRIYIGTSHGFIDFMPKMMKNNVIQPKAVFTGLEIFNKQVYAGSDILPDNINSIDCLKLDHDQNSIRISFSAMSYLMPESNMYMYYLEGYEDNWNAPTHEHSVTYTNLEPGTYILHVRASNNDGVWNDDDTTLKIVITPPFYWNTPVRCLYFLIVIGILYSIVRHVLKKKEKEHVAEIEQITEKKEQEVHEARIKFMTISDSDNEFLKKLEDVIEKNFSNPEISVDFLASEMNVSRSGLFAKVKSLADVTPNEMIQIIRLKHAARLLETKQYRINEICYMVGFNSPSYFTKCFTKHFGVKPAEYNQENAKQ